MCGIVSALYHNLFTADADKKDWLKGSTAVHYAARAGHAQVLKLLVDCGGRYDVSNNEGKTPLDVATGPCLSLLKGLSENYFKNAFLSIYQLSVFLKN